MLHSITFIVTNHLIFLILYDHFTIEYFNFNKHQYNFEFNEMGSS